MTQIHAFDKGCRLVVTGVYIVDYLLY